MTPVLVRAGRLVLIAAALAVMAPGTAGAAGKLTEAAAALAGDPVYVDPTAERAISEADAEELRDRIEAKDAGPLYVAILPAAAAREAGGSPEQALAAIAKELNRDGTYVVVVGDQFRAASTVRESGRARELADAAFRESRDQGVAAVLLSFVDAVGEERNGGGGDGGSLGGILIPLGLAGAAIAFFVLRRRRRSAENDRELAEVKTTARDDLVALGEDIGTVDVDELPATARPDYERALEQYEHGSNALDWAKRPADIEAVSAAVEEGRHAMTAARARAAGQEPPERRPLCFFDPRHGPSVRDVEWTPPWGAPRPVAACAADAQRIEDGLDPQTREVTVGGRPVPYWNAGPAYAPWAGGFYGGFGGLFPGFLLGSMLGGGFGFGGYGFGYGDSGDQADGDFGDGDIGGGDFGGGDFGGGDMGGGDF
jgi:hypothetical protein